jgi:hypothetical protein
MLYFLRVRLRCLKVKPLVVKMKALSTRARTCGACKSDPANSMVWCSAKLGQTICTSLQKKSAAWQNFA